MPAPAEIRKQMRKALGQGSAAARLAAAARLLQGLDARYATCMIWRRVHDGVVLVTTAGAHHEECPLPPGGGIGRQAVQQGAPVLVGNNQAAERSLECYLFAGSELAVPIPGPEGRPVGALHVQSEQIEAFTDADREILETVAPLIGAWM